MWNEKKTNLGSAIVLSAIMLVVGLVIGMNWDNLFGGFAPYLGFSKQNNSDMNWSALDEVYYKLADSYNGEIKKDELIITDEYCPIDSLVPQI